MAVLHLSSLRGPIAMGWRWVFVLGLVLGLLLPTKVYADGSPKVVVQQVDASEFPEIKAVVEVVDGSGIPILGLTEKDIAVLENATLANEVTFASSVDVSLPLGVMLVLDTSGSMRGVPLANAQAAATTFVDQLAEQDQVALITFGDAVEVVKELTASKDEVKQALNSAQALGATHLYDALFTAAEKLTAAELPRKIIIVLTDGEDTESSRRVEEGVQLASEGGILVFTVGIGPSVDRSELDFIAEQTGGTSIYSPSSAEVAQAFQTIAQRLRSFYVLTYVSPLLPGPAQRTLTVDVSQGSVKMSGKRDFTLDLPPLSFEIASPVEGQELRDNSSVEVEVNYPQLVAKMEFMLDGIVIQKVVSPPFSIPLEVSSLLQGSHTIAVVLWDALNREVTKQVSFTIPSASEPSCPTAPVESAEEPAWLSRLRQLARRPALPLGMGLFVVGVIGFAKEVATKVKGTRCPVCGLTYHDRGGCPHCLARVSNPKRPLGQMLIESKIISPNELSSSLADSLAQNKRLGEILVEKGLLTEEDLREALGLQQKRTTVALRRDGMAQGDQTRARSYVGLIFYVIVLCLGGLLLLLFQYEIL